MSSKTKTLADVKQLVDQAVKSWVKRAGTPEEIRAAVHLKLEAMRDQIMLAAIGVSKYWHDEWEAAKCGWGSSAPCART